MCYRVIRLVFMGLGILLSALPTFGDHPDLLASIRAGTVQASFRGAGASHVAVRIQRMANGPLYVRVAPGTYFKPGTNVQGQAVLGEQYVDLRSNQVVYTQLETACTHIHRSAASSRHFMIARPCPDERLRRLCASVDLRRDDRQAIQNAVWAICNNADRRRLMSHGGTHAVGEAARLLERAGVEAADLKPKTRSTSRVLHLW